MIPYFKLFILSAMFIFMFSFSVDASQCEDQTYTKQIDVYIPPDFNADKTKDDVLQACENKIIFDNLVEAINCAEYCTQWNCAGLFDGAPTACTAYEMINPAFFDGAFTTCPHCAIKAAIKVALGKFKAWAASGGGDAVCQCMTPPEPH